MSRRPHLVLVGGFLGAGKTTLILEAARHLTAHGKRCAVILNDQGRGLVDTAVARRRGLASGEVTGGCFCCRFSELADAAGSLLEIRPDVIFAEPVGSCTDLVATVVRPLETEMSQVFRVAPLSVVVDPARAAALLPRDDGDDMAFLFRNQLAEADLVCFSKSDLYAEYPSLPSVPCRRVSGKTGEGVDEWIAEILGGSLRAGTRTLDVDYERYAQAEAALAWLNLDATLHVRPPRSPARVLGPLLDGIAAGLSEVNVAIAHLKATDQSAEGFLKAALCGNEEVPRVEGDLLASAAARHELLLNLRASGPPDVVKEIVERELTLVSPDVQINRLECFQPTPPRPERRIPAAAIRER